MAGNKPINKPIRGIRDSIPGGYILGRTGSGKGPPILLPINGFATKGYVAGTTIQVNGPAGGDLSGTYPNPTVAKIQGNAVKSGTPTDGQVLTWINANIDWEPGTPHYVIAGGTTNQVLSKNSNTDYDLKWATPSAGGGTPYSDSYYDSGGSHWTATVLNDTTPLVVLDSNSVPVYINI